MLLIDQCIDLLIQLCIIASLKPVCTAGKLLLRLLQLLDLPQTFFTFLLCISGGFFFYIVFILLDNAVFRVDFLLLFFKLPVVFCQTVFLSDFQLLL